MRVGIAVPRDGVPAWVAGTIQQLRSVPAIELEGIVLCDASGPAVAGSLFELYRKWAVRRAPEDLSRIIPLESAAGDLPVITARAPDLDVLLWLAPFHAKATARL